MAIISNAQRGGLLGGFGKYEFTIRWSKDKQFYWTLHSARGNTEAVATSETYTTKESAEHSINQIKQLVAAADIQDLTGR